MPRRPNIGARPGGGGNPGRARRLKGTVRRAQGARRGHRLSRKRVTRLMRQAGIQGKTPKRWRKTTIADQAATPQADQIRRDFSTDASSLNSRWCGDITYISTWEAGCTWPP
jgi:transposase InsO family protein